MRRLEVGGRQGRGNPPAVPPVTPRPDRLSYIVAAHVQRATPGLMLKATGERLEILRFFGWVMTRRTRELKVRASVARHHGPWWPGRAA